MQNRVQILQEWGVTPTSLFNTQEAIDSRVEFIKAQVRGAGLSSLVLGISGGVDSTLAGKLSQMAAESLREAGYQCQFIAVRLPYGLQADNKEAEQALDHISPDKIIEVDIRGAVDSMHLSTIVAIPSVEIDKDINLDFVKGNAKARIRMAIQYEVASIHNGLVVGTDNNAEAITGFFTKWGDGASDLNPLRGLNKRQVRMMSKALGASITLYDKVATADLEDDKALLPDEEALGMTYSVIDDFLEGIVIGSKDERWLVEQYNKALHKRMPVPFLN